MASSCIVEGCLFLLRNWSQLLCFASFLNLTMNRVQFHKRYVFPVLFKTVNAGQNAVTKFVSTYRRNSRINLVSYSEPAV